ncbi:MAG: hypothetical protein WBH20_15195 [Oceanisphaera sp.]|uniref:hypothetical protein n=1 Tax=Oceanisphaera sp. TaxID=1929979 RepID=UPI003C78921D
MEIIKDKNERVLLALCGVSFFTLIISGARFPLLSIFDNTIVGFLLTSPTYIAVFENILIGFLAAYIFYLLNSYYPRKKLRKNNLNLLNSCVASILDSYKRTRVYGHETALPYVNTECLNPEWLRLKIVELKRAKTDALKLKFTLDTAHTRENDFRNLLQIASSISPEHAERWLVLIDKVRLLSENYGKQPKVSDEEMNLVRMRSEDSPMHLYHLSLEFRIMELMEVTIEWLELE